MHSFELKTVIAAPPSKVFAVITDPRYITKWDYIAWMQNDCRLGGKVRARDEEGRLLEAEIVAYEEPFKFGTVWPVTVSADEEGEEESRFLTHKLYSIETYEQQSILTLSWAGFPSEELAERERNSWGGYFLEKLKKVAEHNA